MLHFGETLRLFICNADIAFPHRLLVFVLCQGFGHDDPQIFSMLNTVDSLVVDIRS